MLARLGEQLAAETGWPVRTEAERLQVLVPLAAGASQLVEVRAVGDLVTADFRDQMIECRAVAVDLPADDLRDPDLPVQLLRMNARMLFGAWAIGPGEAGECLAVYASIGLARLTTGQLSALLTVLAAEAERLRQLWQQSPPDR